MKVTIENKLIHYFTHTHTKTNFTQMFSFHLFKLSEHSVSQNKYDSLFLHATKGVPYTRACKHAEKNTNGYSALQTKHCSREKRPSGKSTFMD